MLVIAKFKKTKLFSIKINKLKTFYVHFRCSGNVRNTKRTTRGFRYFLKGDNVSFF